MSPELLDPDRFGLEDGRPTKRSDCYALGMVILEVLSGKPPFPNYNGFIIVRKVVEGERPGRPQGREEVWFTDDLWEVLEQCWSPQPERRPTIDIVLQCVEQGSRAWQPLPPDSDDYAWSDSDDQSDFTLSHGLSIEPSVSLHPALNLARPKMTLVSDWINPQSDGQAPVVSQNGPLSVYADQGSQQPSPESQQKSAGLPVSTISDMADKLFLYDNP